MEHCLGQKINVKVIKTAHRGSTFLKKLVSQEILANIGLRKKICFKIPRILDLENVIYIFAYHFAKVGMKPEVPFYNIFMYLYNKNILEYAEIVGSEPKSMILNIEGHANLYSVYEINNPICLLFASRLQEI